MDKKHFFCVSLCRSAKAARLLIKNRIMYHPFLGFPPFKSVRALRSLYCRVAECLSLRCISHHMQTVKIWSSGNDTYLPTHLFLHLIRELKRSPSRFSRKLYLIRVGFRQNVQKSISTCSVVSLIGPSIRHASSIDLYPG